MGAYLFGVAALTGFYLFGAVYHFILWCHRRQDRGSLLFAVVTCILCISSLAMISVSTARSVETAQLALNFRSNLAVVMVVALGWLFAHVGAVRATKLLWAFSAVLAAALISGWVVPLAGTVTGVERAVTPWGEELTVLRRGSINPVLIPAYFAALLPAIVGVIGSIRMWANDRVSGALMMVTALAYLSSVLVGFAIDIRHVSLPYLGPVMAALWVLPMAWQVARGKSTAGGATRRDGAAVPRNL